MLHPRYLLPTLAFMLVLASIASAQSDAPDGNPRADAAPVTATATAAGVRFAAPNEVAQLRLEVYSAAGQKLFDTDKRSGNVLDWLLQDSGGGRLPPGSYLCVVTVKNLSGKLSQRIVAAVVQEKEVELQRVASLQLTAPQQLAIGPLEENVALTILKTGETQNTTITANDGKEGQIIRGHGALSFRIGDFFSGDDREQMRLTEEGNLGIGTSKPKSKLDVAGPIRARQGFVFNDGSTLNVNEKGALVLTNRDGTTAPNAAGTGTKDQLAKWLETGGAGTLGDSTITEANGFVGIGTTNPAAKLDLVDDTTGAGGFRLTNHINGPTAQLQNRLTNNAGAFAYYGITSTGYTQAPILSNRAFFGSFQADTVIWTQTANDILFATNGLATTTERMRIKSSGRVGIGTNNPQSTLDVAGNINTSTQFNIRGNRALSVTGAGGNVNSNTFVGAGAGALDAPSGTTSDGNNNSFFGLNAGGVNTIGFGNSFFGDSAGSANTGGSNHSITTGINNSFFGRSTGGSNTTGSQVSLFGAFADTADALTNATAIGFRAFVGQSNSLVLGGSNGINGATADTNIGIGTATPARHLHVFGAGDQQIGIESSDTGGRQWTLQSSRGSNDGRFEIVDRTANANRFTILSSGAVGIGTTTPAERLSVAGGGIFGGRLIVSANVQQGFTFDEQPFNHVAEITNTSTDNDGVNVLSLKVGYGGGDNSGINYITFFRDGTVQTGDLPVGAIEGNGFSGISLNSGGADYAEYLPRLNPAERIQPGEIVGLFDGHIAKTTHRAEQVFVVSTGPIVLGNDPGNEARSGYERVAFIGQVSARVRGAVRAGDFIIASGLNDGAGIAVSPERINAEQFAQVVGQAWESSPDMGLKSVRVAVGLARSDPTVSRLLAYSHQQSARLVALEARLNDFEARLRSRHSTHNQAQNRRRKTSRTHMG